MAYDDTTAFTTTTFTGTPTPVRAQPQSPEALTNLAKASSDYAAAADAYITARENLSDARGRWQECRDIVAKTQEAEGV